MATLWSQLRKREDNRKRPSCLWRKGCKLRKCPKSCTQYVPDLR